MTFRYALKRSIPVMAGYIVLGIGFGMLLGAKGYGITWALAMSVFIYAGSMQYVAIDLITGGASLISAALMTLMVNARHLFYGISMVERYKEKKYFFLVSLLNQIYWVIGSVMGSVLGSVLNINTEGIDFSMTALFLVVFTEQWMSTKDHRSAVAGVAASVICLLIFGASAFLIPSMISITVILTLMRGSKKTESSQMTA